jgi:hypothetical protein
VSAEYRAAQQVPESMSRNCQSVVVAQYVKAALDMTVVSTVEVCDMRCQLPAKFC